MKPDQVEALASSMYSCIQCMWCIVRFPPLHYLHRHHLHHLRWIFGVSSSAPLSSLPVFQLHNDREINEWWCREKGNTARSFWAKQKSINQSIWGFSYASTILKRFSDGLSSSLLVRLALFSITMITEIIISDNFSRNRNSN